MPWRVADIDEVLGERLDHWDPDLTLRLDRAILVDLDLLRSSTVTADLGGLAISAVLGVRIGPGSEDTEGWWHRWLRGHSVRNALS